MTYPGTKIREHTALESGLIQRVTELEKERDELVAALLDARWYVERHRPVTTLGDKGLERDLARFDLLLAKYK